MPLRVSLVSVAVFLAACPYLSPVDVPFDVQPYALLSGLGALVLVSARGMPIAPGRVFVVLLALFLLALVHFGIGFYRDPLTSARALFGYVSLVVFLCLGLHVSAYGLRGAYRSLLVAMLLYFVVAVLEGMWRVGVLPFNVSELLTARDQDLLGVRGLKSLAPEPSYFAFAVFYIMLALEVLRGQGVAPTRSIRALQWIGVTQLLMSASGSGVLLTIVWVGYLGWTANPLRTLVAAVLGILAVPVFAAQFPDVRASILVRQIVESGFDVLYSDASISGRLFTYWVVLRSLVDHFPFGGGFSGFEQYKLAHEYVFAAWYSGGSYDLPTGRPAGLFAILYDMNVFGVIFLMLTLLGVRGGPRGSLQLFAMTLIPLVVGASLATPIPALLVGMLLSRSSLVPSPSRAPVALKQSGLRPA